MVCDFYIYTYLEIKHKNGVVYIELDKRGDYFCDCLEPMLDSDDEDVESHNEQYDEYCNTFLKPVLRPIVIYENKQFIKDKYQIKYQELLESKPIFPKYWRDTTPLLSAGDIIKVTKMEIRERS